MSWSFLWLTSLFHFVYGTLVWVLVSRFIGTYPIELLIHDIWPDIWPGRQCSWFLSEVICPPGLGQSSKILYRVTHSKDAWWVIEIGHSPCSSWFKCLKHMWSSQLIIIYNIQLPKREKNQMVQGILTYGSSDTKCTIFVSKIYVLILIMVSMLSKSFALKFISWPVVWILDFIWTAMHFDTEILCSPSILWPLMHIQSVYT